MLPTKRLLIFSGSLALAAVLAAPIALGAQYLPNQTDPKQVKPAPAAPKPAPSTPQPRPVPAQPPPQRESAPAPRPSSPPPSNPNSGSRVQNPPPSGQTGGTNGTQPRPNPTRPADPSGNATTYVPGARTDPGNTPSKSGNQPSNGGASTYTPGARSTSPTTGLSPAVGVSTSNGTTTYTPHAATSTASPKVKSHPSPSVSPTAASPGSPAVYTSRPASSTRPVYKLPSKASASAAATPLKHRQSQDVLRQVNAARGSMSGFNRHPLPAGEVTLHPNGNLTVNAAGGRQYQVRGNGSVASYRAAGQSVGFRADGRVSSVHTSALDMRRAANGNRIIVSQRADESVLVGTGRSSGYLERRAVSGNRAFIQRSYVSNQVVSVRTFTTYSYNGLMLEHYVPGFYYAPAFYGWAYYEWSNPTAYAWNWTGDPWYRAYGTYFSPYPVYPTGAAWLTDYYLSRTMAKGFEDSQSPGDEGQETSEMSFNAAPAEEGVAYAQADTPITPELKAAIAHEVQQQLAYSTAAASGTAPDNIEELPSAMKSGHVFVVAGALDVTTADQQQCALSAGDILQLDAAPTDGSLMAALRVASSKRADCPAGAQVNLSLPDLQDMQNNLRAQLDSGLQELRKRQGTGGLPTAPASAVGPPPRPVMADAPPAIDADIAALLEAQQKEAKRTESAIVQTAFGAPAPVKQ